MKKSDVTTTAAATHRALFFILYSGENVKEIIAPNNPKESVCGGGRLYDTLHANQYGYISLRNIFPFISSCYHKPTISLHPHILMKVGYWKVHLSV